MAHIFTGVKVVDLTKAFSGPFATRMLADFGAEVLKVENPQNYDDSRDYPPIKNNWSGYFEILNRNKKGLSLNLKDKKDLNKFYQLCKNADIFVENLTPSTKEKLKIGYQTIQKINPQIIYASLSGLGQESDRKYYDIIAQAESGLMSLSGTEQMPMKIGPSVVDAFSGMTLAFAISSALFYRQKTGKGQYLDVAMLSCAFSLLESNLMAYSLNLLNPQRTGNQDNLISPFGVYKAADGFIAIAIGNNNLWERLLSFLKNETLVEDEKFATNDLRLQNNLELGVIIEKVFSKFRVKELDEKFNLLGIPCSKINQMSDIYSNESNYLNKWLVSLNHSKLGKCVTLGKSINFAVSEPLSIEEAPEIGKDNQEYGL